MKKDLRSRPGHLAVKQQLKCLGIKGGPSQYITVRFKIPDDFLKESPA